MKILLIGSNRENNNKEMKFYNGNEGFQNVLGEISFNSYGLTYKSFEKQNKENEDWEYISTCEKKENREFSGDFEISAQIYFDNEVTAYVGRMTISCLKENEVKSEIFLGDGWTMGNKLSLLSYINGEQFFSQSLDRYNASGRYGLVRKNGKLYFYWGTKQLASIDYTDEFSYDSIQISFEKYKDAYDTPIMYVESLYVGEPLYYRFLNN